MSIAHRFDPIDARCMLQGEAGITNAHSSHPIIGAYGANPCIIIALHDPIYRVAAMAYIDDVTHVEESLELLKQEVLAASEAEYNRLYTCSQNALDKLKAMLARFPGAFKQADETIHPLNPEAPPLSVHLSSGAKSAGRNATLNLLRQHISRRSDLTVISTYNQTGLAIDTRSGEVHASDLREQDFSKSTDKAANALFVTQRMLSNEEARPVDMQFRCDKTPYMKI